MRIQPVNGESARLLFEHAIRVAFGSLTRIAAKAGQPLTDETASVIIQRSADVAAAHDPFAAPEVSQAVGCRVWCLFRLIGDALDHEWLKGYILFQDGGGFDLTEHIVEAAAASDVEGDSEGYPRFKLESLRGILDKLNQAGGA